MTIHMSPPPCPVPLLKLFFWLRIGRRVNCLLFHTNWEEFDWIVLDQRERSGVHSGGNYLFVSALRVSCFHWFCLLIYAGVFVPISLLLPTSPSNVWSKIALIIDQLSFKKLKTEINETVVGNARCSVLWHWAQWTETVRPIAMVTDPQHPAADNNRPHPQCSCSTNKVSCQIAQNRSSGRQF